jgi:gluconate 2-dehydrogenase gamma chain
MERRELFKIIAAGAVVAPALGQEHAHTAAAKSTPHRPVFSAVQNAVLDRLSDIIIPSDEQSPGAHEAGVSHFLDLAASLNPQRYQMWSRGVEAVEAASQAEFSRTFMECTREQQEKVVEQMARNEGQPSNELERFFTSLKPAVIDGYRFSEIGVKQFMRWEGNHYDVGAWKGACNHPEHQA